MMVRQAAKVIAATLIEAIVILGFVGVSLGIGGEGHVGVGPDRPPQLVMPAPVSVPPGVSR
jgi:hypothetical protein